MNDSGLATHLGRYVELTAAEREAVASLGTTTRSYERGAVIQHEHSRTGELIVVRTGWLYCSLMVEDGRRQIVRLHFRGDLLGAEMLALDEAPFTTVALTDADVCVVDRTRLRALFVDHPRLGALLYALQQIDGVSLTDRLVSIGRGSARGSVAALLLWIRERVGAADPRADDAFALPMTQEEIGDAAGLTAVNVNRTMRALAEEGLIARSGILVRILDLRRLARIGHYVTRDQHFDASWLPAAR